jgi:predicted metal-dependent phosphoesterase TrpH
VALSPADVVARAAAAGMRLMALTDHDTVDGVGEALRAAREHGLRCSPAAELSSVSGEFEDLHVCGYELRYDDPELRSTLADFRADRGRRIWAMADRLEELGFALDRSDLQARERAGSPLGRPHLADAVLAHPANAAKLRAEGIDGKDTLFPPYLVPGAAAYVARSRPSVEQAIEVIHAAGGVAVWAHPFWDIAERDVVLAALQRFAAAGLDGVEVFYPTHDEEQTRVLYDAARSRGLLATGSSDFHGPEHPRFDSFGSFSLFGLEPLLGPIGS